MLNNVNRQDSGGLANTNEVASPIGVPGKRELDAWESFAAQQAASSDIGFARINLALLVLSMSPSKSDAAIGHLSDDGCLQKRTRFHAVHLIYVVQDASSLFPANECCARRFRQTLHPSENVYLFIGRKSLVHLHVYCLTYRIGRLPSRQFWS